MTLLNDLPFLKDFIEVPLNQYCAMIGPLEGTTGNCTAHNSRDASERIYCVFLKVWINNYPQLRGSDYYGNGYKTVAVSIQRWGQSPIKKHFVIPELADQFIVF